MFVISLAFVCLIFSGCSSVFSSRGETRNDADKNAAPIYDKPQITGVLESAEIKESSGLAASKCQPDVFWTHNDSGDNAFIFAVNKKGEKLGTWKVAGAKADDWEDIAQIKTESGECVLYIGDIGNNTRTRDEFTIYRVKEPEVSAENKNSSKKNPAGTEGAKAIRFVYPDMRHDAETLMVHPASGDIYILSKRLSGAAAIYKLKGDFDPNKTNKLEKLADFSVPAIPNGFLTGGDISSDGKRVVICDYFNAYELVLPESAKNFDEIWKETPATIELGPRDQGESIAYAADGKSIFAGSENKKSPLIEVRRK
ncbi:MAG TPA: hypothetical protein VIL74_22580 [Pyrinomonadaceae bacterium]